MYTYYCKDSTCQGHTKSWERCCDMRAFSAREADRNNPFQAQASFDKIRTPFYPLKKQLFA